MAIYTKRGDKGETSLYDGVSVQRERVSKDSLRVRAIGAIDELNSFLGVAISFSESPQLSRKLEETQRDLFRVGSILAGSNLRFSKAKTKLLEKKIDELEERLPPLKSFILPGGSRLSALLQYSRALARRAEREVVALDKAWKVKPQVLAYLNRLADLFFMLAREANFQRGILDEVWAGKKR